MDLDDALERSRAYFREKIKEHGPVPQGVDFNGPAAQSVRFDQLIRIIDPGRAFSLVDYGCGYGALLAHLRAMGWDFTYWGYDELDAMVSSARKAFGESGPGALHDRAGGRTSNATTSSPARSSTSSSTCRSDAWREHTLAVLRRMNSLCTPRDVVRHPDLLFGSRSDGPAARSVLRRSALLF